MEQHSIRPKAIFQRANKYDGVRPINISSYENISDMSHISDR
jgi:hypothetical protein